MNYKNGSTQKQKELKDSWLIKVKKMTLRELIKEKGLRKTARELYISPALLNYYIKTSKFPPHLLRRLAEILEIDINELLKIIEKEYRNRREK